MTAIAQAVPDFCPHPTAVGTYASDPDVHFYLMTFLDMTDEVPEPDSLAAKLAELHTKGTSPNGKFGFPVPTNQGALIQPNSWTSSWESFFVSMMQRIFDWEQQMHGRHEEMQRLFEALLSKVIPRLLRPLETGGNTIIPRIVHGDLWDGNASTDAASDKPVIFDASSTYAHNECESASNCFHQCEHADLHRRAWSMEPTSPSDLQDVHSGISETLPYLSTGGRC